MFCFVAIFRMQDQFAPDTYAYSFNPCYPFTEGTCVNAAVCIHLKKNRFEKKIEGKKIEKRRKDIFYRTK